MSSTVGENDPVVPQNEKPYDGRRSGQESRNIDTMNESPERNSPLICERETGMRKGEALAMAGSDSDQASEKKSTEVKLVPGNEDSNTPERIYAKKEKNNINDPAVVPDKAPRKFNSTGVLEDDKERTKIQKSEVNVDVMPEASEQNDSESKTTTGKTPCKPSTETTSRNELGIEHKNAEQYNPSDKETFVSKLDQTSAKEEKTSDNKNDSEHSNAEDNKGLSTFALYQAMAQPQEKANFQQQAGVAVAKMQGDNSISSVNHEASIQNHSYVSPPSISAYSGYVAHPCYYPHSGGIPSISFSNSAAYPSNNFTDPSASTFKSQQPNDEHTKWWSRYYSKYYELIATTLPGVIPPPPPNPWLLPNLGLATNENIHFETNKVASDVAAAPFKKRRVFANKDASGGEASALSQTSTLNFGEKNSLSEDLQDQVATSENPVLSPEKQSQHPPLQQNLEQENQSHDYSEALSESNEKFAIL